MKIYYKKNIYIYYMCEEKSETPIDFEIYKDEIDLYECANNRMTLEEFAAAFTPESSQSQSGSGSQSSLDSSFIDDSQSQSQSQSQYSWD